MTINLPQWRRPALPQFEAARLSPLMLIILAALGALVLLSAAFAAYTILAPDSDAPTRANIDWKAPLPAAADVEGRPPSEDTQTLTRPIFSKDRKPMTKAAAAPSSQQTAPVSDTPTGLTLSAIVRHKKESRAFVVGGDAPQGEWKSVGDKIDVWTITAIDPEELTVTNGSVTTRLPLYGQKPANETPPPADGAKDPSAQAPPPLDGAQATAPAPTGSAPPPDPGAPPIETAPQEPPAAENLPAPPGNLTSPGGAP